MLLGHGAKLSSSLKRLLEFGQLPGGISEESVRGSQFGLTMELSLAWMPTRLLLHTAGAERLGLQGPSLNMELSPAWVPTRLLPTTAGVGTAVRRLGAQGPPRLKSPLSLTVVWRLGAQGPPRSGAIWNTVKRDAS